MRKYKVAGVLSAILCIFTLWSIIALIKELGFSMIGSFAQLVILLILSIVYLSFSEIKRNKITDSSVHIFFIYVILRLIFSSIVVILILSQYPVTKSLITITGFLPYIAFALLVLGYGRTSSTPHT